MTNGRDLLAYILIQCGKKIPVGSATCLMYLADWKHAIESRDHQTITNTQWIKKGDNPHNQQLCEILSDEIFLVNETYGSKENFLISLGDSNYHVKLDAESKRAVDFIISKLNTRTWEDMAKLVASTLPMLVVESTDKLPLELLAKIYAEQVIPQLDNKDLRAA